MILKEEILDSLPSLLEELTGMPVQGVKQTKEHDLILKMGEYILVVEAKSNSQAQSIAQAIQFLRSSVMSFGSNAIALIAVPFMGKLGQQLCKEEGVSYVDLSGNARIEAPGLNFHHSGKPNRFKNRGRPLSIFAAKSSRISHLMLLDPLRWWRQSEIAKTVGLGPGYVSRICKRLEDDRLIERDNNQAIRPKDPNVLLDIWSNQYEFQKHRIRKGHVSAKSGQELVQRLTVACDESEISYALTGLAAAWLIEPFSGYRLVTIYIKEIPNDKFFSNLNWHEEEQGANVWLIRPKDEGVFCGAKSVQGFNCVSSVQTYLDLQGLPERAEEAAEQLRKECLNWTQ